MIMIVHEHKTEHLKLLAPKRGVRKEERRGSAAN